MKSVASTISVLYFVILVVFLQNHHQYGSVQSFLVVVHSSGRSFSAGTTAYATTSTLRSNVVFSATNNNNVSSNISVLGHKTNNNNDHGTTIEVKHGQLHKRNECNNNMIRNVDKTKVSKPKITTKNKNDRRMFCSSSLFVLSSSIFNPNDIGTTTKTTDNPFSSFFSFHPRSALAYDREVGADGFRSADTAAMNIQAKKTNARLEAEGFKLDTREEEQARLSDAMSSFSYDSATSSSMRTKSLAGKRSFSNPSKGSSTTSAK